MEAVLVQDWRHRRATGVMGDGHGGGRSPKDTDEENEAATVLPSRLQIDMTCDYGQLPANRSTGVLFTASSQATVPAMSEEEETGGEDVNTLIPVGEAYYNALREAWSRPPPPPVGPPTMASALPPPTDVDSLDDSFILDSIEQMEGPPLSPVVPLSYMVDLLTPQWEEEGLYDVARRREQRSQAVEQELGRRV